jgi:hypothetical protein
MNGKEQLHVEPSHRSECALGMRGRHGESSIVRRQEDLVDVDMFRGAYTGSISLDRSSERFDLVLASVSAQPSMSRVAARAVRHALL